MKLSVVVRCYNVADEIERCVKSLVQQNVGPKEIILLIDGSTDSTGEQVDRLAEMYPEVQVIHQVNGGLSDARNTGIEAASGEYIAFVDSDDYISEGIYEKLLRKMENQRIDLGIFNLVRIFSDKEVIQDSTNKICQSSDEILKAMFELKGVNFYAWNKIIKRSILEGLYYEKGRMYEDIMFSYQVSNRVNKAIITEEVGYNYIDNDDSIVNQAFNPKQYDNITERLKLYEGVQKTNPKLTGLALDKLVDGFLSTGYKLANSNDEKNKEYVVQLRNQMSQHKEVIKKSDEIALPKKIALYLLNTNLNVYRVLYKLYLGK